MFIGDKDKEMLFIYMTSLLAKERMSKGIKLNLPEAWAMISMYCSNEAREGKNNIEKIILGAKKVLTENQVMPGVAETLKKVTVDVTHPSGEFILVIDNPIGIDTPAADLPGEIIYPDTPIHLNYACLVYSMSILNTMDSICFINSHTRLNLLSSEIIFRDIETMAVINKNDLEGCRLNIPSGDLIRLEPGIEEKVEYMKINVETAI